MVTGVWGKNASCCCRYAARRRHPRLYLDKGVDGRDKPGHDEFQAQARASEHLVAGQAAGNQVVRREVGDDLAAILGDHDLFLDAGSA